MLKNFLAYQSALKFYKLSERAWAPKHLHEQLVRASSSVALNLAEGSERVLDRDKRKFYRIAMASLRECQAIMDMLPSSVVNEQARKLGDETGALVFRLCQTYDRKIETGTENGARGTEH